MPRIWFSSSGNVGVSQFVGGCFLVIIYGILAIIGVLGIAALIYSLT